VQMYINDPTDARFGAWTYRHQLFPTAAPGTVTYVSNFMQALMLDALITIHDHVIPDPRIPEMVKRNLDYLRATGWRGPEGNGLQITNAEPSPSFNYYDVELQGSGGPNATVDLNGLYVNIFAWYGRRTNDASYTAIAEQAFATLARTPKDGRAGPFISGDKQFNETYFKAWQLSGYLK
jgi:hypothetical protein